MITKEHLLQFIKPEILNNITRNNDTLVDNAINIATETALGYLHKYDRDALMQKPDQMLISLIAHIAIWNLLSFSNENIELELRLTHYEKSIKTLSEIQKGNIVPTGWAMKPIIKENDSISGDAFYARSNTPKTHHF